MSKEGVEQAIADTFNKKQLAELFFPTTIRVCIELTFNHRGMERYGFRSSPKEEHGKMPLAAFH